MADVPGAERAAGSGPVAREAAGAGAGRWGLLERSEARAMAGGHPDEAPAEVVVTAEGVPLRFVPAGLGSRAAATALDALLLYALVAAASTGLAALTRGSAPGVLAAAVAVGGAAGVIGYPIVLETRWNGRTVGKAAVGLRVVTTAGGPIGFRQAALRGVLLLVDALAVPFGLIGGTAILCTRRHQRLGDLAAATMVVRERRAVLVAPRPVGFLPPPGWERYAASLDTGRLDAADYRLVRSFLLRTPSLQAEARARLGAGLAQLVAARLSTVPPPGMSSEPFLICVAAAYQRRFRPAGR